MTTWNTYGELILAESGRDVQVFRDENVAKVLPEGDAPNGDPVDVFHGQIPRQLDLNVLPLVASQYVQADDGLGDVYIELTIDGTSE